MKKKIWDGVAAIVIPTSVADCPDCGAEIYADVYEAVSEDGIHNWRVDEDGSGLHIQCTKEDASHYNMPYVDWLPLDEPVIRWLNKYYDFSPQKRQAE